MDRLTELATFVAVIDNAGFAPAARALRRSAPTVTRIIGDLEARIGVRLLDRTSRRCKPTEQGRKLAEDARALLANYDQAVAAASGDAVAPRGPLRVTASYFFGREHVAPALMRFVSGHDGITAELDLTDRVVDIASDGFDLAVRIGRIADMSLTARRVGSVARVVVASPEYLRSNGEPKNPAELREHELVQHGSRPDEPWRMRSMEGEEIMLPVRARFTVNQADAALAAARSGHGLVTCLSYQVHADLASGELVRILCDHEPEPLPVHLAWPEGRDRLLRVRMLIDHLAGELTRLPVLKSAT